MTGEIFCYQKNIFESSCLTQKNKRRSRDNDQRLSGFKIFFSSGHKFEWKHGWLGPASPTEHGVFL